MPATWRSTTRTSTRRLSCSRKTSPSFLNTCCTIPSASGAVLQYTAELPTRSVRRLAASASSQRGLRGSPSVRRALRTTPERPARQRLGGRVRSARRAVRRRSAREHGLHQRGNERSSAGRCGAWREVTAHRKGHRHDRGDRAADEPARAERRDRGGARRRARKGSPSSPTKFESWPAKAPVRSTRSVSSPRRCEARRCARPSGSRS